MPFSSISRGLAVFILVAALFCGATQAEADGIKLFNSGKKQAADKAHSLDNGQQKSPTTKNANVTTEFDYDAAIARDMENYNRERNAVQKKFEQDNAARMKQIQDEYAAYFTALEEQAAMKAAVINGGVTPSGRLTTLPDNTRGQQSNPYEGKTVVFKNKKEDGESAPRRLFNIPGRN